MQTATDKDQLDITLRNEISELVAGQNEVRIFLERRGVGDKATYNAQLVLEERIMNTIQYGYADGSSHQISLNLIIEGDDIVITFKDDGDEFNPIKAANLSRAKSLDEPSLGGRGLLLIRKIAKKMRYQRENGINKFEVSIARG